MRDVFEYKPRYDWIINPVGQIVQIGEREEVVQRFCTGFNISAEYFLTAGHCLGNECRSLADNEDVNIHGLTP